VRATSGSTVAYHWYASVRIRLTLIALTLTAVGCGAVPPSPTAPVAVSLAPGEIALPTAEPLVLPSGVVAACAGVGISAVLRGDPHDPHVAWLVGNLGSRVNVTWPPAYRARFVPALEVLDAAGNVVLRDSDPVTGACVTGDPDVLHLELPFR
jgi:hypothetical protein